MNNQPNNNNTTANKRFHPDLPTTTTTEENLRKQLRPPSLSSTEISQLSLQGLENITLIRELDSYDDRNYLIQASLNNNTTTTSKFVLKFHNGVESTQPTKFIHTQINILKYLHQHGFIVPLDVESLAIGRYENQFVIRVLHWIEGETLYDYSKSFMLSNKDNQFASIIYQVGSELAAIDLTMKLFIDTENILSSRKLIWDLANFQQIRNYLKYQSPTNEKHSVQWIKDTLEEFDSIYETILIHLPKQIIQNDANDRNILVIVENDTKPKIGLIDMGDLCETWHINQLAIALCYLLVSLFTDTDKTESSYWLDVCFTAMYQGYQSKYPLTINEIQVLPLLIKARLCTSISLGAYSYGITEPKNPYLLIHSIPAWNALQAMVSISSSHEFIKRLTKQ
jgi:Ser/Thr protein kinase RdoA (MazF antagonist)